MRSKIEEKIINLIKEIEAEESRYPQKRNPPGANQTGFKNLYNVKELYAKFH